MEKSLGKKARTPRRPWINILDYRDIEFMIVFLHECGHIMDKDNSSIELETTESEISA